VGQGYKTFFVVSITLWLTKLDRYGHSVHCLNKLVRFTVQTFFVRVQSLPTLQSRVQNCLNSKDETSLKVFSRTKRASLLRFKNVF
jgi:hypothetical protein